MSCIKKGDIYLANLGDKALLDIGKIRPVVIFQNNFLNKMIEDVKFKDVVVLPLSSQIRQNDFSYFIKARQNLQKDSVILCNAIKMIDASRLLRDNGALTTLCAKEIEDVEKILYNLFGCNV
ncbi:MAG TPA: type II toxin-antitoxin system PemK/MazF family toxin [Campylobacterales bacterium]|nr:type II toxin-antitoxin system PemK/MazF family toxin [Campylobacterales bacterium]